jgi:hypothetical protein
MLNESTIARRLAQKVSNGTHTRSHAEQYMEERGLFEALELFASMLDDFASSADEGY